MQRLQWITSGVITAYLAYKITPSIFWTEKQEQKLMYKGSHLAKNVDLVAYPVIEELIDHPKFDVIQLAKIHFFWSNTLDPVQIGSSRIRFAVSKIGLPINLSYTAQEDANLDDLGINSSNNANTEGLMYALQLSDRAKKFLIANEIHMSNTYKLYSSSVFFGVSVYAAFITFVYLNLSKVKRFRFFTDLGVLLVCAALYKAMSDKYAHVTQETADIRTANMGRDYIEGGIEYMDKVIERNTLLLAEGDTSYTKSGNHVSKWYSIETPAFTRRKAQLENILKKKLEEKEAVAGEDDKDKDEQDDG